MKRVAINGLGRIGRLVFRLLMERDDVEVVAVNDLSPNDILCYLLQYDTAQGTWNKTFTHDAHSITVDNHRIVCLEEKEMENLPWKDLGVDIVIECTGRARNQADAMKHIRAGATKVVISAPADKDTKTIVIGINDHLLTPADVVVSNASCTTNCLAPMVQTLIDNFHIGHGIMNTIHAYTGDQRLQDGVHGSDFRRARAAAENITPTSSNATKALEWVIPQVKGKIIGGAVRVPVVVGSLTELIFTMDEDVSVADINAAFKEAAENKLKGVMGYTEDPIVSSDIIHSPLSCLFDAALTQKTDTMYKIVGWYDNEYGYANRLVELVIKVADLA